MRQLALALFVLPLHGSVSAAPLAQLPSVDVQQLYAIGGIGLVLIAVVAAVLLSLILLVWRAKPQPKNEVDVITAQNQRDLIALNEKTFEYQQKRDADLDRRAEADAMRLDALNKSLDKTNQRLFEFNAEAVRNMAEQNAGQRANIDIQKSLLDKANSAESAAATHESNAKARSDTHIAKLDAIMSKIEGVADLLAREFGRDGTTRSTLQELRDDLRQLRDEIHKPVETTTANAEGGTDDTTIPNDTASVAIAALPQPVASAADAAPDAGGGAE